MIMGDSIRRGLFGFTRLLSLRVAEDDEGTGAEEGLRPQAPGLLEYSTVPSRASLGVVQYILVVSEFFSSGGQTGSTALSATVTVPLCAYEQEGGAMRSIGRFRTRGEVDSIVQYSKTRTR
jgi:hypothetical protein